jgi:hypothetical protein
MKLSKLLKPFPVVLASVLGLGACAGAHGPQDSYGVRSLPQDAAAAERKAYAECAVQAAFSVPLPELYAADALAQAAVAVCEPLRRAVFTRLVSDHAALPDAAALAAAYVSQVDAALASHLALRLREAAGQHGSETSSGSSI